MNKIKKGCADSRRTYHFFVFFAFFVFFIFLVFLAMGVGSFRLYLQEMAGVRLTPQNLFFYFHY